MKRPISAICSLIWICCVASLPVFAATATVTNVNDSGSGSLRDAIANAASGDTINFNLAYPATITLGSTLSIGINLTISGPGQSNLAISGNNAARVFYINPGITAAITGLTIMNGRDDPSDPYGGGGICNAGNLTLTSSTLSGNSSGNGGGIANYGTLTVSNSTLSGNSAFYGSNFGQGGGISNDGPLTIDNSALSGNSANYAGGILNWDVPLTITSSTLSGNSATYDGGGIYQEYGPVTVTNSTLSGNSASGEGGGIRNYYGTLMVNDSTLSNNTAGNGGGLFNYGASTLTNSTLSGNQAIAGGGIFNFYYALTVSNSTVAGNSANYGGGIYNGYALTLKNTILASNPPGNNCYITYTPDSNGHNLSDDYSCFLSGIGDMNSTPAGLNPAGLQNNGGPTQTIALQATSPAVDAIPLSPTNYCTLPDGVTPVASDQRGVPRPQFAGCDIGAYELKPSSFSSFAAKLDLKGQGFALNAAFTVGADASQIDPLTQAVQLQIGPYIATITAGSFHQTQGSKPGSWAYAGTINGVKLNVQISAQGGGGYQLNATGSPVNFNGVSNPVTVAIGIGFDAGSTQVIANF